MKSILIAFGLAVAVLSCATDASSQTMPGRKGQFGQEVYVPSQEPARPVPRTASRDDLIRHCRNEIFRKYGQRAGSYSYKWVMTDTMIQLTDACVANGGTVN